ncbi:hypothetical protein JZ751_017738 [Albula glossodonta]|uniref:Uncharacterized protein n=1 Tax=Albula glossodonta TaxID=121402 RepID=A0A8T2PP84_9TELE|nr:hypothetical protein JZ751_017738 [Albula glossodonta]
MGSSRKRNANVERGFSINKESTVENQKERSLVAQRLIVDHEPGRTTMATWMKRKKEQKVVDLKRKALMDEHDAGD